VNANKRGYWSASNLFIHEVLRWTAAPLVAKPRWWRNTDGRPRSDEANGPLNLASTFHTYIQLARSVRNSLSCWVKAYDLLGTSVRRQNSCFSPKDCGPVRTFSPLAMLIKTTLALIGLCVTGSAQAEKIRISMLCRCGSIPLTRVLARDAWTTSRPSRVEEDAPLLTIRMLTDSVPWRLHH
jgi:hypothetical protein